MTYTEQEYAPVIAWQLEKAGFSSNDIEHLSPVIARHAIFTELELHSNFFNFRYRMSEACHRLNITRKDYMAACRREAILICRNPQTLQEHAQSVAEILAVPEQAVINAALTSTQARSQLLVHSSETIRNNFNNLCDYLTPTLDRTSVARLILSYPAIIIEPKDKISKRFEQSSIKLGIDENDFRRLVAGSPSSLIQPLDNLAHNSAEIAKYLGFKDSQDFLKSLLRSKNGASFFARSIDTVKRNIEGTMANNGAVFLGGAELLGVPVSDYKAAAKKRISLMAMRARHVNFNARKLSRLLGLEDNPERKILDETRFIRSVLKNAPQLLTMNPYHVNAQVEKAVALLFGFPADRNQYEQRAFKTAKKKYVQAIFKAHPQIFYQSPNTLFERTTQSARALGYSHAYFMELALKKPTLMYRKPETLARNAALIRAFQSKGIITRDVEEFIKGRPDSLCNHPSNYHLRYFFARASGISRTPSFSIFRESRASIERKVVKMLGHAPDKATVANRPDGDSSGDIRNHRRLLSLIRRGIIKSYKQQPDAKLTL